jgi:hypothetical protein
MKSYMEKLREAQARSAAKWLDGQENVSEPEKFLAWQRNCWVVTEADIKFLDECGISTT